MRHSRRSRQRKIHIRYRAFGPQHIAGLARIDSRAWDMSGRYHDDYMPADRCYLAFPIISSSLASSMRRDCIAGRGMPGIDLAGLRASKWPGMCVSDVAIIICLQA